ncbi:cytochrome c3 family protein [Helicobacter pullorum]|uniref:cytochrome c3 family protein n=1 Tax=Helicobacter pullorum TaxID=35818 RepID=UPI00174D9D64|nr:NapC/NirT family cytochrome c [Helicobacter pullorum]
MKKTILLIIFISVVVTLVATYGGYKAIKVTGEYPFCGSCHAWDGAIAETNVADKVHGASNPKGVQATCAECHLPHDSLHNYLFTKAKNGLAEGWTTLTGDPIKKDWLGNREHARKNYTFDSSCLQCHSNAFVEANDLKTSSISKMHQKYLEFKGTDEAMKCTDCHKHVGHTNLGGTLFEAKSKEPQSWEEWEELRKERTK